MPVRCCSICGAPAASGRCVRHPRRSDRGDAYRQARAVVLAEELVCWRCGEAAREGDPLTADHVVPRVAGGADVRGNMRAAHRSCNSRAGQALQQGLPS